MTAAAVTGAGPGPEEAAVVVVQAALADPGGVPALADPVAVPEVAPVAAGPGPAAAGVLGPVAVPGAAVAAAWETGVSWEAAAAGEGSWSDTPANVAIIAGGAQSCAPELVPGHTDANWGNR